MRVLCAVAGISPVHGQACSLKLVLTERDVGLSEREAAWQRMSLKPPETLALRTSDRIPTGEHSRATIEDAGGRVIHLIELTVWELRKAEEPRRPGVEIT